MTKLEKFAQRLEPQARQRLLALFAKADAETDPIAKRVMAEQLITRIRVLMKGGPRTSKN